MAKQQKLIWTVVPNGLSADGSRLRASLVVSPRLAHDAAPPVALQEFADFLDWPARLAGASLQLAFQGGPTVAATPVSSPSSPVWTALFGPTTPVTPYAVEPLNTRRIRSYPVAHVADFVLGLYADLYQLSPDAPPHPGRTAPVLEPFRTLGLRETAQRLERILGDRQQRAVPAGPADPAFDAAQAIFFHDHSFGRSAPQGGTHGNSPQGGANGRGPQAGAAALAEPEVPRLDFHQALGLLASYPSVQRLFGLVIDIEVPLAGVPVGPAATTVRAQVSWTPTGGVPTTNVTPPTAYQLEPPGGLFRARPKEGPAEGQDGLLPLTPGPGQLHAVVQVDTDGAVLKLNQTADITQRLAAGNEPALADDVEDSGALPTLNNAGLAVVRANRAFRLARRLDNLALMNLAIESQPDAADTLYLDDLVAGWRLDVRDEAAGRWHSLCARQGPWRILNSGGAVMQQGALDDEGFVETGATTDPQSGHEDFYLHETLARWTGWSLVAPRPGRAILPDDEAGSPDEGQDPDFRFRADLVAKTASLPRLRFGKTYRFRLRLVDVAGNGRPLGDPLDPDLGGASAAVGYHRFQPVPYPVLVPRALPNQDLGESVERLLLRSNAGITAADYAGGQGLPHSDERHVVPPRAMPELLEQHGFLDGPGGLDKAAYALLVAREGGLNSVPGALMGGPEAATLVLPAETFALPYLPDPACLGACFRGLPGLPPGGALVVPFGGIWPDLTPFRLHLVEDLSAEGEAETAPQFDPGTQTLTVWLKKAARARVRLSAALDPTLLDLFGQWRGVVAKMGGTPSAAFRQAALDGRHWLLSPDRRFDLVHAVQQPLEAPGIQAGFAANRNFIGQRDAVLTSGVDVHGPSTGQVALRARWTEPYDDPNAAAPAERSGEAPAGTFKVRPTDTGVSVTAARVTFPDTHYRRVAFTALATTRFRADFPAAIAGDAEALSIVSAPVAVDVANSARPPAPRVRYVLPTFRWEDTLTTRTRRAGLRVWLDRPWWTSGDGELLAVILDDGEPPIGLPGGTPTPQEPDPSVAPYVTRWAEDPIWDASDPGSLRSNRFPHAARVGNNLTIEELRRPDGSYPTAARVSAVGHAVHWDVERKLWFCDIDVQPDAGAFWPFIRLALARYQPTSLPNAHLSRVVVADFAQVAPERVISLTDLGGNRYGLGVSGPQPRPGAVGGAGGTVTSLVAGVEQAPRSTRDEDVRDWSSVGSVALVQGRDGDWTGEFLTRGDATMDYRVVVRELESFPATDEVRGEAPQRLAFTAALEVPHVPIPTPTPTLTPTPATDPEQPSPTPRWTAAPSRTPASTLTPRPDAPTAGPTQTPEPSPSPGASSTPGPSPTVDPSASPDPSRTPGGPTETPEGEDDEGTIHLPFASKR